MVPAGLLAAYRFIADTRDQATNERLDDRALLELDLILERFGRRHAQTVDLEQAILIEELLESEDHDLWEILSGKRKIADPRRQGLVQRLRDV